MLEQESKVVQFLQSLGCRVSFLVLVLIVASPALASISWQYFNPTLASSYVRHGDSILISGRQVSSISTDLFANEHFDAGLVLTSDSDIQKVLMSAKGLTDAQRKCVDIRYLLRWYQADGAWHSSHIEGKQPLLVPELLTKDPDLVRALPSKQENYIEGLGVVPVGARREGNDKAHASFVATDAPHLKPLDLITGKSVYIVVSLNTTCLAESGRIQFSLSIDSTKEHLATVPVDLNILPNRLPVSPFEYAVYYRGQLGHGGKYHSVTDFKTASQLLEDFKLMKRIGLDHPTVYQPDSNLTLLKSYMALRNQAGIPSSDFYYLGLITVPPSSIAAMEALIKRTRLLKETLTPFGLKHLYVYGEDEASPVAFEKEFPLWRRLNMNGIRILAAGSLQETGLITDLPNIFVANVRHKSPQALANRLGNRRFKLLAYANPQAGPENPALWRRNYGIWLWQAGFDGAMIYAYQHAFGSPWRDGDGKVYRDHMLAYPGANGPIPTVALLGIEAAIDDTQYLTLLENLAGSKTGVERRFIKNILSNFHKEAPDRINLEALRKMVIKCVSKGCR